VGMDVPLEQPTGDQELGDDRLPLGDASRGRTQTMQKKGEKSSCRGEKTLSPSMLPGGSTFRMGGRGGGVVYNWIGAKLKKKGSRTYKSEGGLVVWGVCTPKDN